MKIHGGFSLNLMNTAALEWAEDQELEDVELSLELSLGQAARLGGNIPRGLMVYGRMPLMLTRNCPAANGPKGCLHCQTPPVLTDRKGMHFPCNARGDAQKCSTVCLRFWRIGNAKSGELIL